MAEIEGRLCVVTGTNSDIGKETARGLIRNKANVAMGARARVLKDSHAH